MRRLRLCLRLRRRREVAVPRARPDLPSLALSQELADWLAGPRGRLLRRARIGQRQRVLEVGSGHGIISEELARRCAGELVALDRDVTPGGGAGRLVGAEAGTLPFADCCFDLVFFQNVLLWVSDLKRAIAEATRVLEPGGALVAIEPDFGGMLEHPPEVALRDVWLKALGRAGADAEVGRKLPGLCEAAGLSVWCELQSVPRPATAEATELLEGLPLTENERHRVAEARTALSEPEGKWEAFIHVPYVLVVARKRT